MKRDAKELVISIAAKCNFEPAKIVQMINVNQKGLKIKVDDDVVRELPEGQDMILEYSRIAVPPVKHEWDEADNPNLESEDVSAVQNAIQYEGYILKLIF
jgi:hypothetical protein